MTPPLSVQPLVLLVDDEPRLARAVVSALASRGFRTLQAPPRTSALARILGHQPDLVLVDASHPGVDGAGLTARLRGWSAAPILVMAGAGQDDRREILEAGASDLIVRPFSPADLLARVRLWVRQRNRTPHHHPPADVSSERLRIDRDRRALFVDGREVHITPLECKLLLVLAHNSGRAMSEEQILAAVWGPGARGRVPYLRAQVRQLRQKLEKDPSRPRYLVKDMDDGYRLRLS